MMELDEAAFDKARTFLASSARGLELSLFMYHFERTEDSRRRVIEELASFQNPDGGFGNALEPDVRMVGSSVVATKFALQVLIDVGAPATEPIVGDAVGYILRAFDGDRCTWPLVTDEVSRAPHAPWWDAEGLEREFNGFLVNPRAGVLRCLLDYEELVPQDLTSRVIGSLKDHLRTLETLDLFDLMSCLLLLQADGLPSDLREMVSEMVVVAADEVVERDPSRWGGFSAKPLWLAPSPRSPLADQLMDLVEEELDYEINAQGEDGYWSPTWSWGERWPDDWRVAEVEWGGVLTLAMLRSLRDFGRIPHVPAPVVDEGYRYHID
jgi:hypothetical protein